MFVICDSSSRSVIVILGLDPRIQVNHIANLRITIKSTADQRPDRREWSGLQLADRCRPLPAGLQLVNRRARSHCLQALPGSGAFPCRDTHPLPRYHINFHQLTQVVLTVLNFVRQPQSFASLTAGLECLHLPADAGSVTLSHKKTP